MPFATGALHLLFVCLLRLTPPTLRTLDRQPATGRVAATMPTYSFRSVVAPMADFATSGRTGPGDGGPQAARHR